MFDRVFEHNQQSKALPAHLTVFARQFPDYIERDSLIRVYDKNMIRCIIDCQFQKRGNPYNIYNNVSRKQRDSLLYVLFLIHKLSFILVFVKNGRCKIIGYPTLIFHELILRIYVSVPRANFSVLRFSVKNGNSDCI